MSQAKHTPGPWTVVEAHSYTQVRATDKGIADIFDQRDQGSTVQWRHHEWEANARLIAAAPWMYEALEAILDADGNLLEIEAIARTAIAKAEGAN